MYAMSNRKEIAAYLVGVMFGGAIGAVLALIYAPRSGQETRSLIRERYIDLQERVNLAAEQAHSRIEAAYDEMEEASEPAGPGGGRPEEA